MNKNSLFSGLLGGLVVAAVVAILLATGVVDTGDNNPAPRPTIAQAVPDTPQSGGSKNNSSTGKSVSQIYDQDGPGVAFIQADGSAGEATGSGLALDKQGYILTNAHVVEGARSVQVSFNDTGDLIDAKIVGADPSTDLALIK